VATITIERNARDGEIGCPRVAFDRHCPALDDLRKSLKVELEFKPTRENKKMVRVNKDKITLYAL